MRHRKLPLPLALALLLTACAGARTQQSATGSIAAVDTAGAPSARAESAAPAYTITPTPDFLGESEPRASMLLLGTFHFADAGLDGYKPRFHVEIKSPERQAEIEQVVRLLAEYRPTKVAVEWPSSYQARVDSLYRAYLAGTYELGTNEVYQLGFRLARLMGHERVWLVDAPGRMYEPDMTDEQYKARADELRPHVRPRTDWDARYRLLYGYADSLKTVHTLREQLLFINAPDRIRQTHGHYLVSDFHLHTDGDWFGPDMSTRWYNRNLRIFANLQRITESEDDRIIFIVGSGHLPILRFLADASPEYELVEPGRYLGR